MHYENLDNECVLLGNTHTGTGNIMVVSCKTFFIFPRVGNYSWGSNSYLLFHCRKLGRVLPSTSEHSVWVKFGLRRSKQDAQSRCFRSTALLYMHPEKAEHLGDVGLHFRKPLGGRIQLQQHLDEPILLPIMSWSFGHAACLFYYEPVRPLDLFGRAFSKYNPQLK